MQDKDWEAVLPFLTIRKFAEKEVLLSPNNVCTFIAFITEGSIRTYHQNDQLVETNLLLRSEYEFVTEYESFVSEMPTKLFVEAIDPGEAIVLSRKGILKLYETSLYWNQFGRMISEQIFVNSKRRTEDMLFSSPKERYLSLMENRPDFFQKYSLKHISSYLGITPQSLSRIRNQLTKNEG